jgi:hypothetical protein
LTAEVVTPKNRATPAPEYPMPFTATWQNTRRARTPARLRLPERNSRSVTPGPALEALIGGARRARVRRARQVIASLWIEAGRPSRCQLAPALGVHPQSVCAAAQGGCLSRAQWARLAAARAT